MRSATGIGWKLVACLGLVGGTLLGWEALRLAPLASQEPTPAGTKKPLGTGKGPTVTQATPLDKNRAPLFDGWPKPDLVLVFTGQQMGYIEPCGCAGLDNQKGGLARRHTLLKDLEARGWNVAAFDVGNQVHKFGKQQEMKFERTAEALRKMNYKGVTFGNDDLKLATGEVFGVAVQDPNIFLAANVALVDRELTPTSQVIEMGGRKIGVTAALGPSYEKQLPAQGDVIHQPPASALPAVIKDLAGKKCDLNILLAHATLDETRQLAQKFPQFQIVATAGGYGEPPLEMEKIPGTNSYLVEVGQKGMYVAVVGVYNDPKKPFRYQRVPLDSRFADSPAMMDSLAVYQRALKSAGFAGLGINAQPHPKNRRFVGTEKCGECHTEAMKVWQNTPHAHATASLVKPPERFSVARHFDPECLSCHVTGWDAQKVYPYNSGYMSQEKTPHLQHNGCENCHGPGSAHVAAEEDPAKFKADLAALRGEMRLPLAGGAAERKCLECHDLDNSPKFHEKGAFEKYWKAVEHKGKG